jgi:hypothetical protein
MSLISILVTLIVAGILLWLVNTYIPMDAAIKKIINIVAIIVIILWLINIFGLLNYVKNIHTFNNIPNITMIG